MSTDPNDGVQLVGADDVPISRRSPSSGPTRSAKGGDDGVESVGPDDDANMGQDDENNNEDDEDEDEGDDDEEEDDDVFVVEAIKKHMVDEGVKWEGWESKSDLTWEPEENLVESAGDIVKSYLERIGGRQAILDETSKAARGKKRGRPTTTKTTSKQNSNAGSSKRPRGGGGSHPRSSTPPVPAKWLPPSGSWEDEINDIDACEDEGKGKLIVYLNWKNGRKTKHDTSVIYKKCPQKMLQFYERHVKIIRDEAEAAVDEARNGQ
ncbi:chromobox protein 1 [Geosmithia morbida]|uniref:Chromobox protein 1 n=1 Tax=Geosmithia morbida TaxID=1094350 RepID=A0A9P4YZ32_9HYPO|nr:chromobox protein 1 [Geosmithia morbida]KAF4125550.1 chromobox protein 1 [Geosmithia morbida]